MFKKSIILMTIGFFFMGVFGVSKVCGFEQKELKEEVVVEDQIKPEDDDSKDVFDFEGNIPDVIIGPVEKWEFKDPITGTGEEYKSPKVEGLELGDVSGVYGANTVSKIKTYDYLDIIDLNDAKRMKINVEDFEIQYLEVSTGGTRNNSWSFVTGNPEGSSFNVPLGTGEYNISESWNYVYDFAGTQWNNLSWDGSSVIQETKTYEGKDGDPISWAVSTDDETQYNLRPMIVITNDSQNKKLYVQLVLDHQATGSLDFLKLGVGDDKFNFKGDLGFYDVSYELEKINVDVDETTDNINDDYGNFPIKMTYEDLSWLVRNNWVGDDVPWGYVDLEFRDVISNEIVWKEGDNNRNLLDDFGETHLVELDVFLSNDTNGVGVGVVLNELVDIGAVDSGISFDKLLVAEEDSNFKDGYPVLIWVIIGIFSLISFTIIIILIVLGRRIIKG